MSRDYIENPAEDAAFSTRRMNDTLDEIEGLLRRLLVIYEMTALTDAQRAELREVFKDD